MHTAERLALKLIWISITNLQEHVLTTIDVSLKPYWILWLYISYVFWQVSVDVTFMYFRSQFVIKSDASFSAVACERYLGTFWPLRYKELVTLSRAGLVFFLCIAYPGISVTPLIAVFNSWKPNVPCLFFAICPMWLVVFVIAHVFLCVSGMAITYVSIIRRALQLQKQVIKLW